jgi:hypothetical protein
MSTPSHPNIAADVADTNKHTYPEMPPPPYLKAHFINPSSFKAAINTKLDRPLVSLFRLSIRILQFAFALAAGISYAAELSRKSIPHQSTFIYSQVVFGLTLLTLVIDSITVRYYRLTWIFEWVLAILWFVCFAVFYQAYSMGTIERDYQDTDLGPMRRAVWCDLINALLWSGSAIFSSAMCCTGTKAAITNRLDNRRQKKEINKMQDIGKMESGLLNTSSM